MWFSSMVQAYIAIIRAKMAIPTLIIVLFDYWLQVVEIDTARSHHRVATKSKKITTSQSKPDILIVAMLHPKRMVAYII